MADELKKRYSAMFIYNRPKLRINRNTKPDYVLSYEFVEFAVEKNENMGFRLNLLSRPQCQTRE